MNAEILASELKPHRLVRFEQELRAGAGNVLVKEGALAGIQIYLMMGGFPDEVAIWLEPLPHPKRPDVTATIEEVAERTRFATRDEEIEWLRRGDPS